MSAVEGGRPLWAVVPVKSLAAAKRRLAGVLSAAERRQLVLSMLEDVLGALREVADGGGIEEVSVVTCDPVVRDLAVSLGVKVVVRERDAGHTEAVVHAARVLRSAGCGGMLTVPGDVPLVSAAEVGRLLAAHGRSPAVTLAPARDGLGSNGLICSPPDVLPLRFGEESFRPHVASARRLGISPAVVSLPGLGLDIDRRADLEAFVAQPSATRTWEWLQRSGLAASLRSAMGHIAEAL